MHQFVSLVSIMFLWTSCHFSEDQLLESVIDEQIIVDTDIGHFLEAYDSIRSTSDTVKQLGFLTSLFLDKASDGQLRMMRERRYSAEDYLQSIADRPLFWNSIRSNLEQLEQGNKKLIAGIDKFKSVYPELDLATIYYTIGTHRSPGTGVDSMVMIGSEFALGDSTINTSELPPHHQNYYKINPVDWLEFLTVHEYVHTQQEPMVHDLLSLTLYEGIAEFVAIKATGSESPWKAFTYGPIHDEKIRARFEEDMFKPNTLYGWLWNSPQNEFGTSDLAYYVGYQIAAKYYDAAANKEQAIKDLIKLDYTDENGVEQLVDASQYFSSTLHQLQESYETKRPVVTHIQQFTNGSKGVESELKLITLHFSEPMNTETRGFDYGPLGEDFVLRVENVVGFADDGKSFSFNVKLTSGKKYQSMATNSFQSASGLPMKPFLIEFQTM